MIKYSINSRVKLVLLMLSVVLGSTSCNDILDEQPISEIGPDKFWNNNIDAASGVTAIYDAMQTNYRLKYSYWGELRSDNFSVSSQASAKQEELELPWQSINNNNTSVLKWDKLYQMINRANQAIKNIPLITGYDANLLAEAHALRAFAYFDAVRVWGAVPLFTEPTNGISDISKSRTDAVTILNTVIIPDMIKAEQLMVNPNSNFRFSKASIYCLQGEVYMWLKDYPKAKTAMGKMITNGGHSLVTTVQAWEDLFYNNIPGSAVPDGRGKIQTGPELIFSIRYNIAEERDNPGEAFANRSGLSVIFFAGIPSYYISPALENKWREKFPIDQAGWEAKYPGTTPALSRIVTTTDPVTGLLVNTVTPVYGDFRYYSCRENGFSGIGSIPIGSARFQKWHRTNYSSTIDDTDIVVYRYAGMLLLLAEAENQLGAVIGDANTTRALQLVNQIRAARKLPAVTATEFGATKEARENFILDERQFELAGEGKRWWDLRRTNKALEVLNPILSTIPTASQLTTERLLFPVYFEHLIENPKLLPQNAGYTN